ncbi:MAG: DUF4421 family protein [Dysgonomonas sp.]|nr:DUF4421 family protein [Dysgonomonas sp.]
MKKFLVLLLLSVSSYSYSQINYNYIEPFDQKVALKGFLAKKFLFLFHEYNDKDARTYMPNNPFEIGLGLSINNTAISFGYGYGFNFLRDRERGKTSSFDFQFHHYGRKYTFDIFFQKYKGFYMEDDNSDVDFELCPDLKVQKYGVDAQYIFNNKKFSYKAAFSQSERQLRSAGSFLLGGGAYYTYIESDTSFIYNEKNYLKNFQFGVSGGYTYTWVIKRDYFINLSITGGVHFGNETIDRIGKDKLEIYPSVFPRMSMGYNKEKWSIAFSYLGNMIFPAFAENNNLGLMSGNFQFTYTHRFDSTPPLSR